MTPRQQRLVLLCTGLAWLALLTTSVVLGCNPLVGGGCPAYVVLLGARELHRTRDIARGLTVVTYASYQTSSQSQCGMTSQVCSFDVAPPPMDNATSATVLSSKLAMETCMLGGDLRTAHAWWIAMVVLATAPFVAACLAVARAASLTASSESSASA